MPKLTKRLIDSLEADAGRDHFIWDSRLTGFGLRLTRTGRQSYVIQYRTAFGRSRRMTLGTTRVLTPDQARKEASRLLARARQGEDPAEDRRQTRHGLTFKQLADRYLPPPTAQEEAPLRRGLRNLPAPPHPAEDRQP